jgi:hypothetical protein
MQPDDLKDFDDLDNLVGGALDGCRRRGPTHCCRA